MDRNSSDKLIIRNSIQCGRPTWLGQVERMEKDSWVKKCREIVVEGHTGRGRPYNVIEGHICHLKVR